MFFAMLLSVKGFIFLMMGNKVSILDILGGFYLGIIVYGFSNSIVTFFFCVYLGQKGLLSLIRI